MLCPRSSEAKECNNVAWSLRERDASAGVGRKCFPGLERVVMGDFGERWWYHIYHHHREDDHIKFSDGRIDSLPQYFINLPSVQHYCQSELFGPFALPCKNIRTPTPPKIVTYHMPVDLFEAFQDDPFLLPPVVLGAINRYVFPESAMTLVFPNEDENDINADDRFRLRSLIGLMERVKQLTLGDCDEPGPSEVPDRSDTVIEMYNYIERIKIESVTQARAIANDRYTAGPLHVLPLALLQQRLDDTRVPKDPKIYLKTLQEAEPCTACDFDFQAAGNDSPQRAVVIRPLVHLGT